MLKFSSEEIKDIIISTIVLAVVFGGFGEGFVPALIIISLVFLTHELLGHKLAAQYLGFDSEYRKWNTGLALALLGSFVGFIFAAPGAVYIKPTIKKDFAWTIHTITKEQTGIISLAGPAVNIIFGYIFILLAPQIPVYETFILMAARFSFFLALFNLLPFGPLDGNKVSAWSWKIWGVATTAAGLGYFLL
jgi:Zn-dependent protease